MTRTRTKTVLLFLITLISAAAVAQGQDRSVTRVMLDRGRAALDQSQYQRADTIARDVLSLAFLARSARAEAFELLAAANFPRDTALQHKAVAINAISQFIQLDLSNAVPTELAWPGLDSLYKSVLAHTYAISVNARRDNPITGIDGTAPLRVRANEPSTFVLTAQSRDGIESIILDSASSTMDTVLNLRVGRRGALILHDAQYDFVVTARQLSTGEVSSRTFDGVVAMPTISYVPTLPMQDSVTTRPERSRPQRALNIATAVGFGAVTIAIGLKLRAAHPISTTSADDRCIGAGILMTVGASIAAWFDRGRPLDRNIAANRGAKAALSGEQAAARQENARRAAAYRAFITLDQDAR